MIISIIGAGSLGKTYGGLLSFHHEVHYLVRSEYNEIKQNNAFSLDFVKENQQVLIQAPLIHNDAKTLPPSDLIIIALKTTENKSLGALLENCLKPDSIILVIQNGIGNEEWVATFTANQPIVCGVASMGAYRLGALKVEIPILGELRLAPFNEPNACAKVGEAFQKTTPPIKTIFCDNYRDIRWKKLLWNVPFSSLSIIYQQDAQTLASTQPYAAIVQALMNEIVDIAKAENVEISQDYIMKMLALTKSIKGYFPSMFHDYANNKPIEKEYIIDNVLAYAQKHQLHTPMLRMIASHLAAL